MTTLPLAPSYRSALRTAILVQLLLAAFLLLILDGGKIAAAGACAIAGFWIGAAIVLLRRPQAPRRVDLLYIRWGYLPLLLAAVAVAAWVRTVRG